VCCTNDMHIFGRSVSINLLHQESKICQLMVFWLHQNSKFEGLVVCCTNDMHMFGRFVSINLLHQDPKICQLIGFCCTKIQSL
jgi:hypothetical protein